MKAIVSPIFVAASLMPAAAVVACEVEIDNRVPLVQLIANPERWDGQEVRVLGFARFEYEGDALYLSEDDYQNGLSDAAVGLYVRYLDYGRPEDPALNTKANDLRLVEVQGVFRARKDGSVTPVGANTGSIGPICMLQPWDLRREGGG